MSGSNWLLTGIPRAGTSVSTRLLNSLPDTVALNEPLQLTDFEDCADAAAALERIVERFREIREQITSSSTAPAVNVAGAQSDARVMADSETGLRRPQGEVSDIEVSASPGFRLVIKQNALFTALLHRLVDQFECLALIRNPLDVLASWQTVDLPVNRGRLPGGERYDSQLANILSAEEDCLHRQLCILDWFYRRFHSCLPNTRVLRFEDVATGGVAGLARALGERAEDAVPLELAPLTERYRGLDLDGLLQALFDGPTAWRDFYTQADCERALG